MPKYVKKPVIVTATQWRLGDDPLPCMRPYEVSVIDRCPAYADYYYIDTLEGAMHVGNGDYVITGIQGEHYPCKAGIFEKTYEAYDED